MLNVISMVVQSHDVVGPVSHQLSGVGNLIVQSSFFKGKCVYDYVKAFKSPDLLPLCLFIGFIECILSVCHSLVVLSAESEIGLLLSIAEIGFLGFTVLKNLWNNYISLTLSSALEP